jgi:peptide/nickel transport system substrate-binding protein
VRPSIALGLLLAGCVGSPARHDGTVILASGADLESMNSLVTTHPFAKQIQRYALLTTLVRYDSALGIVPYLARSWRWSADHGTLTMILDPNVRWHDGRPTTAADAAWTLSAAKNPATGYPRLSDLESLARARASNDTTLELQFARRQEKVPDVLTDLAILPRHRLAAVKPGELRRAEWNVAPVGNGPFRFARHEPNRRWVFTANHEFPRELGGPPRIERLVVAVVDEPTTKLAALASGELDFAGIQPAHAAFVRRDPRLAIVDYPMLLSYAMVFNTRRPPFDRLAPRRAVSLAIDREAIIAGYLFGFGTAAGSPLPPELDRTAAAKAVFAPGRGRALLGSSAVRFELLTVGSGEAALEQMIQAQLARIGVVVTIRQLELSAFLDRVTGPAHDFDAAIMGVSGDLDQGYLRSLLAVTGFRARHDAKLERVFVDSLPAAFLYHARGLQGMNRRMEGVRMDLRGELVSLTEWRPR